MHCASSHLKPLCDPLRRHDCIRLLLVILLALPVVIPVAAIGRDSGTVDPVQLVNDRRAANGLAPLQHSSVLGAQAEAVVQDFITRRCLCPAGDEMRQELLSGESPVRHAGELVLYDASIEQAMAVATSDFSLAHHINDPQFAEIGIAWGTVPLGSPWLVPPVGGGGPDIDLTGYVIVVILLAGAGP